MIGHFIAIWMISYADKVIVTGMRSRTCISSLLYSSDIGRHTSIFFLNNPDKGGDKISVAQYVWEHNKQRPNTHTIPVACPVCHTLQPWNRPDTISREDGGSFTLRCTFSSQGTSAKCPGTYKVESRPHTLPVDAPYLGLWRSYVLDGVVE